MVLSRLLCLLFGAGVFTAAVGSSILVSRRQAGWKREMTEFAKANHFELLGRDLPDGFVLRGTTFRDAVISNVVKGTLRDTDVVVFTVGFWAKDGLAIRIQPQTVVAFPNANGLGSRQIPPTGDPNLYMEVAGDWLIVYQRHHFVRKEQLIDWCEEMCALTQKLTTGTAAG
jgi:hypothetical protein